MNDLIKYILIVDDNLKNLQLIAKVLKDEGFLISLAQDGKNALSQLEQLTPDLILLDVMMPEMDGYELCRLIKKDERLCDIPVIFLTAKTQTEDLAEGFKAGGVDYITKPFNREELLIRVKNHIELAGSRKKIIEMSKNQNKLYSVIAHDVRAPFSGIAFTISAIANGYLKAGSADFLEVFKHLETTTKETSMLLDNLLEWTKLQSEVIPIYPCQLPLHPMINDCIQLLKVNASDKNIKVTNNVSENVTAFVDQVTIHTVFRNLIVNAIKFTPSDGSIDVCASVDKNCVKVSVKDTGVGIPEDKVAKIFHDNEHYTTPGTNKERGSGLGSFIIRDFVKINKGKIEVKSKPGSGTEIIVSLPLE
jgi:two-component system, sensor histidine kinase and response regulator